MSTQLNSSLIFLLFIDRCKGSQSNQQMKIISVSEETNSVLTMKSKPHRVSAAYNLLEGHPVLAEVSIYRYTWRSRFDSDCRHQAWYERFPAVSLLKEGGFNLLQSHESGGVL